MDRNQGDLGLRQLLFFMTIAIGCSTGISAVSLLGDRRVVAVREAASGACELARRRARRPPLTPHSPASLHSTLQACRQWHTAWAP